MKVEAIQITVVIINNTLLFASLLGFLFSLNLFVSWKDSLHNLPKLFFSIYLFFISMIILDAWESFEYNLKTVWILDAFGFLGPALYFFILSYTDRSYIFNKTSLILFIPGILELFIQLLRIIDYRFLEMYYVQDTGYALSLECLEIIAFVICVSLCARLLKLELSAIRSARIFLSRKIRTFLVLNIIIVVIWGTFLMVDFSIQHLISSGLVVIIAILIIIIISDHIRHPEVLNAFNKINKRKKKILNNQHADQDVERIIHFLNEYKPYKDSDFNLSHLSASLCMPKDYVSELINHQIGLTFKKYLNELRVKESIHLFQDPKYAHLSIAGIAYEVGYLSESNFYRSFKQITKSTPKVYLNTMKNKSENNHS